MGRGTDTAMQLFSFLLAAFALLAPASALQLTALSGAPAIRSSCSAPRMALPSIADAKNLSDEEIVAEIFSAQKELFELRKKVKTRQEVKPHLFTHTKHRIAQLQSLLGSRQQ